MIVGVSVSVGFVVIVVVIVFCAYRCRRRSGRMRSTPPTVTYSGGPQPQIQIMQSDGMSQQIQFHPVTSVETRGAQFPTQAFPSQNIRDRGHKRLLRRRLLDDINNEFERWLELP